MAWIDVIGPEDATGSLDELYDEITAPEASRARRSRRGRIHSAANDGKYCVRHHAEAVQAYWNDEDRVPQLIDDYTAPIIDSVP